MRAPLRRAAALAAVALAAAAPAAPAAAQAAKASLQAPLQSTRFDVDAAFVVAAVHGFDTQIDMAQLAQRRALQPATRAYAARVESEDRTAGQRLSNLVPAAISTINDRETDEDRLGMLRLERMADPIFDSGYLGQQLADQYVTLSAYEAERAAGENAGLRKFAGDELPAMRRRYAAATAALQGAAPAATPAPSPTPRGR